MPLIALQDGQTVIPEVVGDGEDVFCPTCNDVMRARGPFTDGTAQHFYHVTTDSSGGCRGQTSGPGESVTHRKLKSLAVSALRQTYVGEYTKCAPEVSLDVSETETEVDERRADALLEFRKEVGFSGGGLSLRFSI